MNDANILIDLVELELLSQFFGLPYQFHTTALVFEELDTDQQKSLNLFVDSGALSVAQLSAEQLVEIDAIRISKPTLSTQDCSAYYQAKVYGGILLTSDNSLRRFAKANRQKVHGHLWVFDRMVEHETVSKEMASMKLQELCSQINLHLGLPREECELRYERWKS